MKHVFIYTLFLIVFFNISCGQSHSSKTKDSIDRGTESTDPSAEANDPTKPARYEYADAAGKRLIIQNSFPRGGLRYKDLHGQQYIGAIFWTRITNETDHPLQLQMAFSGDTYELPSSKGSSLTHPFKVMLHSDTMALEKEPLTNYGLKDLQVFCDSSIHKPSSLKRTIKPNETNGFYVVRLAVITEESPRKIKGGGNGTTRAGLSLQGQNLIYTLNGNEIPCGQIDMKNLVLKRKVGA